MKRALTISFCVCLSGCGGFGPGRNNREKLDESYSATEVESYGIQPIRLVNVRRLK